MTINQLSFLQRVLRYRLGIVGMQYNEKRATITCSVSSAMNPRRVCDILRDADIAFERVAVFGKQITVSLA